jgi:putative serine protease PepD
VVLVFALRKATSTRGATREPVRPPGSVTGAIGGAPKKSSPGVGSFRPSLDRRNPVRHPRTTTMIITRLRPVLVALVALAGAAVVGLAGCSNSPSSPPSSAPTTPPPGAAALQQDFVQVVQAMQPSVVQITTDQVLGSGVVFDTQGNIVTNAHVVAGATTFQVRLAGSPTTYPATLVGAYPPDDIAVIHLDTPPPSLKPAQFADSSSVQAGDMVLAMGSPLGLTGSVTNGIVSATGRTVTEPGDGGAPGATIPDAIQTSAAINPGNSGGALVNLSGQVVGMPTLAALDPELGESPAPGIGFAISSNLVTDVGRQLVANNGHVTDTHRAELGVQAVTVLGANDQPAGAGIARVTAGGPAAAAGLTTGEVITAINDTPVQTASDLVAALANLSPGASATLTVTDVNGQSQKVTVTLGQLPGS